MPNIYNKSHPKSKALTLEGLPVRDGERHIHITITIHDAKTGQKDAANCAAAKACRRLKGVYEARVYRTRSFLKRRDRQGYYWERYKTPDAIRSELIAFDRGGVFLADDYTFPPLGKNQRLGAHPPWRGDRSKQPGNKRKRPTPHIVKQIRERAPLWGGHRGKGGLQQG